MVLIKLLNYAAAPKILWDTLLLRIFPNWLESTQFQIWMGNYRRYLEVLFGSDTTLQLLPTSYSKSFTSSRAVSTIELSISNYEMNFHANSLFYWSLIVEIQHPCLPNTSNVTDSIALLNKLLRVVKVYISTV